MPENLVAFPSPPSSFDTRAVLACEKSIFITVTIVSNSQLDLKFFKECMSKKLFLLTQFCLLQTCSVLLMTFETELMTRFLCNLARFVDNANGYHGGVHMTMAFLRWNIAVAATVWTRL